MYKSLLEKLDKTALIDYMGKGNLQKFALMKKNY